MTYKDAKRDIQKLNARLRALKKVKVDDHTYSYDFAIEQLKNLAGIQLTKSGTISTAQKTMDLDHMDKYLKAAESVVPTVSEEEQYIKNELAQLDLHKQRLYGTAIPQRTKAELMQELAAKRYYDLQGMTTGDTFDEAYEEWVNRPLLFSYNERQKEIITQVDSMLGYGQKGIKTYAQLYEIETLIYEYFASTL